MLLGGCLVIALVDKTKLSGQAAVPAAPGGAQPLPQQPPPAPRLSVPQLRSSSNAGYTGAASPPLFGPLLSCTCSVTTYAPCSACLDGQCENSWGLARGCRQQELRGCGSRVRAGHYILLAGYDSETDRFMVQDPASAAELNSVTTASLEAARLAYGTDEDLLLISLPSSAPAFSNTLVAF